METVHTMEQAPRQVQCSRCEGKAYEPVDHPGDINFGPCFKCEGRGTIQLAPCGCWWSKPLNVEGFGTIHIECQNHYEDWYPS